MGRHRADEQPLVDPPSVSGAAAEATGTGTGTDETIEAQWVQLDRTVLVAGPASVRSPRTRIRVLVGAAVTLALALLTLAFALNRPSTTATWGESAVDGADGTPTSVDTPGAAGGAPTRPVPTTSAVPTTGAAPTTTSAPSQSQTTTTPVPATVTGTYSVQENWGTGFTARVLLTNPTVTAQDWQIVIEYPATVTDYATGWSNAAVPPSFVPTARGVIVTGQATLAANQSLAVFVQFANQGTEIAPTLCLVNATACE